MKVYCGETMSAMDCAEFFTAGETPERVIIEIELHGDDLDLRWATDDPDIDHGFALTIPIDRIKKLINEARRDS